MSTFGVEILRHNKTNDAVLVANIQQNRDWMMYMDLRWAVVHGKVGHIEDMLLELLVYFLGGRNKKYAAQVRELLQILYHECTPDLR